MKRVFTTFLLLTVFIIPIGAQKSSILVLGDLHYDLIEDHDIDWLSKKPDDLRQVTHEYTIFTANHWSTFMNILRRKVASTNPPVKGIIQLGDL